MAANLRPRRPLWPVRRRLALWLAIEVAVLLRAMVVTGNDFAMKLRHLPYALEIGFFGMAGLILAAMALCTAIPGRESRHWQTALPVALVLGGTLILFAVPMRTDLPLSQFVAVGSQCAFATFANATLPWIALWWAVRRGAPGNGRAAGAMVGASAMLFSFAIMRIVCPIDEPLHLVTWHLGPAIAVTLISTLAGAVWLRFPRRRAAIAL
jgi:negative regulator of sigma F NrsF-like protein